MKDWLDSHDDDDSDDAPKSQGRLGEQFRLTGIRGEAVHPAPVPKPRHETVGLRSEVQKMADRVRGGTPGDDDGAAWTMSKLADRDPGLAQRIRAKMGWDTE